MRVSKNRKRFILSGSHSALTPAMLALIIGFFLTVGVVALALYLRQARSFLPSEGEIRQYWEAGDYASVYDNTSRVLESRPFDGTMLAYKGFASYYLYASRTEPSEARSYLSSAITALRNAWYRVTDTEKPMLAYVLGKAYYQQGYYYADLAMKYLDIAATAGLQYDDLSEFRGLAAALLGDTDKAIVAFTEALEINPTDMLLYTLAQQYIQVGDTGLAKQYLSETIRTTNDDLLEMKARYALGTILFSEGDVVASQLEYETILKKDVNFTDAHYGLGVIYEQQGDLVRARASWRRALRLNPVHQEARKKLNLP